MTVSEQRPAHNVGRDNVANKTWLREAMPRQEGFGSKGYSLSEFTFCSRLELTQQVWISNVAGYENEINVRKRFRGS